MRLQTSVGQLDAVVSIPSPSVELRSWLHSGNWGRRQRTPNLAHDRFHQIEDVLCHVSLTFLRAAYGSGSPCLRSGLVQVLDRSGGEPKTQTSAPATAGAQVLAEFVLMDDPVIRLICASDGVSRPVMRIIEPDDLIAAFPSSG